METRVLTPMQQLLKEIGDCRNIETDLLLPFIKNKIIKYLPKEQEAMINFHYEGQVCGCGNGGTNIDFATEYFNRTYKEHGK